MQPSRLKPLSCQLAEPQVQLQSLRERADQQLAEPQVPLQSLRQLAEPEVPLQSLRECAKQQLADPQVPLQSLREPLQLGLQLGLQLPALAEVTVSALEQWEQQQPDALKVTLPCHDTALSSC